MTRRICGSSSTTRIRPALMRRRPSASGKRQRELGARLGARSTPSACRRAPAQSAARSPAPCPCRALARLGAAIEALEDAACSCSGIAGPELRTPMSTAPFARSRRSRWSTSGGEYFSALSSSCRSARREQLAIGVDHQAGGDPVDDRDVLQTHVRVPRIADRDDDQPATVAIAVDARNRRRRSAASESRRSTSACSRSTPRR